MQRELDISMVKFEGGWNGVRIVYSPNESIALMEIHSWNETQRFRIDLEKCTALDLCSLDQDDLKEVLARKILPRIHL